VRRTRRGRGREGRALLGALLLGTLLAAPAAALSIQVRPSSQRVGLGGAVEVAVALSGLGDLAAPSLSTYDLELSFDAARLAFEGASFGDPLLGDPLDVLGLGSVTSVGELSPGRVELFALSLDSPADLERLQRGDFTLATVRFTAVAAGTSAIAVVPIALGDAFGDPLDVERVENGSVAVVPEPAACAAFAAGLGVIALSARRRARARS
jgi:hypothetical protein